MRIYNEFYNQRICRSGQIVVRKGGGGQRHRVRQRKFSWTTLNCLRQRNTITHGIIKCICSIGILFQSIHPC